MSSEDVIELGSSDEETQPAAKKRKLKCNAMVEIPNKIPGLTIKPTKSSQSVNPVSIAKGIAKVDKSVTVTKVPKSNIIANPYANKNILNGKTTKFPPIRTVYLSNPGPRKVPVQVKNLVNMQTVNTPNNTVKKAFNPLSKSPGKAPIAFNTSGRPSNIVKPKKSNVTAPLNIPVHGIRPLVTNKKISSLSNLPPGLTIKKTSSVIKNVTARQRGNKVPLHVPNQIKHITQNISNEVLTVDLDDEPVSTKSGPQWYIRPEDEKNSEKSDHESPSQSTEGTQETDKSPQKEKTEEENESHKNSNKKSPPKPLSNNPLTNLEEINNKEPDKSNFIEITIEDSPIKPILSKKGFKVGAELAITIDDSPVKSAADKTPAESSSEDEQPENTKEPNSKKKLEYPMEVVENVIEIEIEPLTSNEPESQQKEIIEEVSKIEKTSNKPIELMDIVEIEESPIKPIETEQMVTPKKKEYQKPRVKMNKIDSLVQIEDKGTTEEFQPAYQTFINLCFQLENSEDMKKIVEKKIKNYYRQVPKEYTESEQFTDMVLSKVSAMKAAPEKMYLYIKDIVDELDLQRKLVKKEAEAKQEEHVNFLYGEDSEFDSKRQRQIRKLEKTLKRLHRAIQKLEEQEVDFDDEEDSVYLLTDRYKERMVRVHAKLCQLTNTKMPSEPRIVIEARPGQPKGPAKRLEKWVNKKVPIGKPLPFPDFHDVLHCVREANQQDKLGWNEADIMEEARDLFTRCGKKLQRRRQENEWRLAASRIQAEVDPATNSDDLKKKLEENTRVAAKRETEVLNKYADRQNLLKLEAVEIGDKEAEESPVESDDEETVDDTSSLESKEKRKERLKRLLHEKSKKDSSNKKQTVSEDDNNGEAGAHDVKKTQVTVELEISDNENNEEKSKGEDSKSEKVNSCSDDSSKVESDIDELHLLQKLHSGNEINSSTQNSTDSDSPISISDASISSSEEKDKQAEADVISIENSSYSESEERKDDGKEKDEDKEKSKAPGESNELMECSDTEIDKLTASDNEQTRTKYFEEILLASDDDVGPGPKDDQGPFSDTEIGLNLNNDSIPIGDTVIVDEPNKISGEIEKNKENDEKEPTVDTNEIVNSSTTEEIGISEVHEAQNEIEGIIAETASIQSLEDGVVTEIMSIDSTESEEGNVVESNINSVETHIKNGEEITLNAVEIDKEAVENSNSIKKALENTNSLEANDEVIEHTNSVKTNNEVIDNDEAMEDMHSIENNDESINKTSSVDSTKGVIENLVESIREAIEDSKSVETNNEFTENTIAIENKVESTENAISINNKNESNENTSSVESINEVKDDTNSLKTNDFTGTLENVDEMNDDSVMETDDGGLNETVSFDEGKEINAVESVSDTSKIDHENVESEKTDGSGLDIARNESVSNQMEVD